jgi:cation diffusion facilitator CzcD-associated flavoprotein CzcO
VTAAADRYDVVVVGGGQAGLALGYFLSRDGRHFKILEARPTVRLRRGASGGTR